MSALDTIKQLYEALALLRSLVDEGGVPRYTVTPGAALNSVIEESVDPALRMGREFIQLLETGGEEG